MIKQSSSLLLRVCLLTFFAFLLTGCGGQNASETASDEETTNASEGDQESNENSSYPEKPITIYSLFGSGGAVDQSVRLLADELETILDTEVNIEILEGAGGSVAITQLSNEEPDGYTLSAFANTPFLATQTEDLEYKVDDFTFVSSYVYAYHPLMVSSDSQWENIDELIEWAKDNPGKLTWSGGSPQSPTTITTQIMFDEAGVEAEYVPYDGGNEAMTALMGGHLDAAIAADYAGPLEAGDVRLLAEASGESDPDMDIPTYGELGYSEGFLQQYGIVAPEGLPSEITQTLNDAIAEAVQQDDYVEAIENMELEPLHIGSEELGTQIRKEVETVGEFLEDEGNE
ncbi:tripartite tricarboxylate transporter substrate binding protein [Alteribacillus sp. YIM 98480]|uniref:tripartite tricarboxylate transporter substrate binding protein n=1 Tax=Alteribacillus sp. YIM 98480 TaxID=2606599 RepID=UPI00131E703E|nr:tripartite tricarboxylate transporter substrate binding protein [Alteribacillus sp. YIM 98480]